MTGAEIALVGGALAAFVSGIEVVKALIQNRSSAKDRAEDKAERSVVAATAATTTTNHGPCNVAVDNLTDVIKDDAKDRRSLHDEDLKEQQAFRLAFEKWMAEEAGYRRGLRDTSEHPAAG